jgi:hypothetical protein
MNTMHKNIRAAAAAVALSGCVLLAAGAAFSDTPPAPPKAKLPKNLSGLAGPFDLASEPKPEVRYYTQETRYVHLGFDGKRIATEIYTMKLRLVPAALSGKGGDEYTVGEFAVRTGAGEMETIPELAGWSYVFDEKAAGVDDKNQLFGISHARFENLNTNRGRKLAGLEGYPVWCSFIDFHMFCDAFARPTKSGAGIQDLKTIGQTIRHSSAFSEAPVAMGTAMKEGSVFRNGDVRLGFKGLGVVDGAPCAVVGYDSGESTVKMIVPMTAGQDIVIDGGSEYFGDIDIDLATRWVRRATLEEFVVTETRVPGTGAAGKVRTIQAYTVRHILVRLISREEFEAGQAVGK